MQLLFFTLFVPLFVCVLNNVQGKELIVEAPAGTFKGTSLTSIQGHQYAGFLGIPFALPPVGNLRFAKPDPYPKIDTVYEATKMGPICIQPIGADLGSPGKEDCLYLNVFLPHTEDKQDITDNDQLKKVFVYIHGGAFFMGSANEYIPGDLVALGDIIVVTFNYRLSWLGFLKGNTPELPGNQGMWDQLMALNWVKDNIKSFGGDPDDITIGGESMGGESVSALSIVAQGKGLFTRGLIMSGTMFASPSTPGSSDILLDLLTNRIGCKNTSDDLGPGNIENVVKCLRELPEERFILPVEGGLTNKFTTIDGELFVRPISELIIDEEYLEDVGFYSRDYIVSLTNNEGAIFFYGPVSYGQDPEALDPKFVSSRLRLPLPVCEKILAWYTQSGNSYFSPGYELMSDPILNMPCFNFLEVFASRVDRETKSDYGHAYFLWFEHMPSYLPYPHQGTFHGVDLSYLFDLEAAEVLRFYYDIHIERGFTEEDFKLKKLFIDVLTDFMKKGDPTVTLFKNYGIRWQPFDLESEHYLRFQLRPSISQFPLEDRRQFWTEKFPMLMDDFMRSQKSKEEL